MVDFRLELIQDKSLYARVMLAWASQPHYGIVARCPGCKQYVWFDPNGKRAVTDLPSAGFDLLPDDWHVTADIM
jgi:hypothetical protein